VRNRGRRTKDEGRRTPPSLWSLVRCPLPFVLGPLAFLCCWVLASAQVPTPGKAPAAGPPPSGNPPAADVELVQRLLAARREYQTSLEQLRAHYLGKGDVERAQWAEEELRQFHRVLKQAFLLELDVPVPTLQAAKNIPEANELYRRAMTYKDKGWG